MTLELKSTKFLMRLFSIDSIAKALSLTSDIVFLKNVLTHLSVEKHLSASEEDIGIVIRSFKSPTVSEKVSSRLFSTRS